MVPERRRLGGSPCTNAPDPQGPRAPPNPRPGNLEISVAPGFSRVSRRSREHNRFSGFCVPVKPLKRLKWFVSRGHPAEAGRQ